MDWKPPFLFFLGESSVYRWAALHGHNICHNYIVSLPESTCCDAKQCLSHSRARWAKWRAALWLTGSSDWSWCQIFATSNTRGSANPHLAALEKDNTTPLWKKNMEITNQWHHCPKQCFFFFPHLPGEWGSLDFNKVVVYFLCLPGVSRRDCGHQWTRAISKAQDAVEHAWERLPVRMPVRIDAK